VTARLRAAQAARNRGSLFGIRQEGRAAVVMSGADLEAGSAQGSSEGKLPAILLALLGAALCISAFFFLVGNVGLSQVKAFYWVGISAGIGLSLLSLGVSIFINRRRTQRERDLFASSLDTLPIARQIVAPDGKVIFASTAFRQMFPGVETPVKAILAAHLAGDSDAADRLARLEAQAAVGIAGHTELTMHTPAGIEWRDISASPLQLLPGYVVWGVEDVTPRRQVEAIIRREQERFADLVERAPIGFYSVDESGRFEFINATLSKWLDIPRADVAAGRIYLRDLLAVPPAKDAPPYSPFAGETTGGEITLRGPDGKMLHAYVRQEVVPGETGAGLRTRSVVHDLGRERALEAALRSSEQRFQRFFAEAPIGIVLIDQGGRVQECNAAFRSMVGVQSSDLLGYEFLGFIDEQDRPVVNGRLSAPAAAAGPRVPLDISLKSLQPRKAALYIASRDAAPGGSAGWIAHFIDITERKNLEMQVSQSQKMQAVGQLAGGIAHDFNNLLTAMIGFCDLLLVRHRAGDQSFADIMQIKQNANRAANLVRQLLAFSRQQTLQPRVLNVTDVLAELSHLLRRLIGENIELKMTHGRDLAPVKVDHGQLEQVIINLAVNARDAMVGGGTLAIRTENVTTAQPMTRGSEIMPPGGYVMVQVIDTGHGIPAGIIDRIFDPFFSTKEVGSGTGLGLSTVYGIVKQTGGFIFVESKPKQGATFSIYLPRHVPDAKSPEPVVTESMAEAVQTADLTGIGTVLLVEDEDAVRLFGARALRNKGYNVLEARSGEAALEIINGAAGNKQPIDLLITDVVMPRMDGPTLIKQVRAKQPNMKVIFISGYAEDAFRKRLDENADIHFLPKPFTLKQLAGKVKEVLREGSA
jgi:two-component system cell cycle sensor histidine kinase/response regulator CckA